MHRLATVHLYDDQRPTIAFKITQWRSQRGVWGFKPPIRIEAVFSQPLLNIITSL